MTARTEDALDLVIPEMLVAGCGQQPCGLEDLSSFPWFHTAQCTSSWRENSNLRPMILDDGTNVWLGGGKTLDALLWKKTSILDQYQLFSHKNGMVEGPGFRVCMSP